MNILIIDGQGGGVGKSLVEGVRAAFPTESITAVGTNSIATSNMMRAGALVGATGENAVIWNAGRADVILGPIGVFFANSMAGEITPKMAEALAGSAAEKIAIPASRCHIRLMGVEEKPLKEYISQAITTLALLGCKRAN